MNKSEYNEYYLEIGRFMSKANTIEFLINITLEKIIYQYSEKLDGKKTIEEVIDVIEGESIKRRINFIILFISMTSNIDDSLSDIILQLKKFSTFYNKHVRDIRDFVAHNPLIISPDKVKIVSSRRYKGRFEALEKNELIEKSNTLTNKIQELNNIVSKLSEKYSFEVTRDVS